MNKSQLVLGALALSLAAVGATNNTNPPAYSPSRYNIYERDRNTRNAVVRKDSEKSRILREPSASFVKGNFRFHIYEDDFYEERGVAEVMPGWDKYSGDFDVLSLFPDGKIELPASIIFAGKSYKVIAVSEFGGVPDISEFILPSSVKVIRHGAFERTEIERIVVPDGVEEIEYDAFRNCRNLKYVKCGKRLSKVSGSAFKECTALQTFEIDPENPVLETIGNFLVSKENKEAMVYYGAGVKNLVIPEGIESLTEDLCRWDENLETVTVSEGVKVIDKYAFMECPNLREVKLPSTLESLEWGAFNHTAIEELIVPENVRWLADCVGECPNLKKIYIGKGTSLISNNGPYSEGCGHAIGKGSNAITEIIVDPENQWFASDEIGLYTKNKNSLSRIIPTLDVVDLSKTNITSIGSDAASYGNNSQIILPEHLKIIDGRPFEGTRLTEPLHLPFTMTHCNWDLTYGYVPTDIYYHSNIPWPYLTDDQFMDDEGVITMHVPAGRKEVFENSHSYSHFKIVDDIPEQKMNCIEFGYHGDRFSHSGELLLGPAAEGAILIPTAQLRAYEGMQIAGVNFDNSFSQSAYIFIDRLSTGERIMVKQMTPIEQGSLNHIRFDNPYVIRPDDEDLLVGIGFDDIGDFAYSKFINPVGNYWREKGQTEWQHGDPSSMTCRPTENAWMWTVSLEGEKMPVDGRLMNVRVEEDFDAKVYRLSGYFNNMSAIDATEVEIAYSFLTPQALFRTPRLGVLKENGVADGSVKACVDAQPMRAVPFTAEIPMPESGTFVLAVDVASINGEADDMPENSMIYEPVYGQDLAAVEGIDEDKRDMRIVRKDGNRLLIEGVAEGMPIAVFSLDGIKLWSCEASYGTTEAVLPVSAPVIVKAGDTQSIIVR